MAIMFKKMIQNAKAKRAKRDEEIAKFKAEWYARPYLDRVKRPAIIFVASLVLGLCFEPHSELISGIMFVIAFGAGFLTFGYAIGGCPLSPVEWKEQQGWEDINRSSCDVTDPAKHYLPHNIHNRDRW